MGGDLPRQRRRQELLDLKADIQIEIANLEERKEAILGPCRELLELKKEFLSAMSQFSEAWRQLDIPTAGVKAARLSSLVGRGTTLRGQQVKDIEHSDPETSSRLQGTTTGKPSAFKLAPVSQRGMSGASQKPVRPHGKHAARGKKQHSHPSVLQKDSHGRYQTT